MSAMTSMTVKTGQFNHWWHAAHMALSMLTFGWWLLLWALHVVVFSLMRPSVVVEVPEGHRVEYRDGWPNVLGPDEYLEPRTPQERLRRFAPYSVPAVVAVLLFAAAFRAA